MMSDLAHQRKRLSRPARRPAKTDCPRGLRGALRKRMAPRERGAIRPSDLRVTKRESTKSQWDKPATIGPPVDCPRVGARSSHGAVGLSPVGLLPFLLAFGSKRKS